MTRAAARDPVRTVRTLHARAVGEYAAGRPARARTSARRALALLDAPPSGVVEDEQDRLRVRVLVTLAIAEAELAAGSDALVLLDEAADLADRLTDPVLSVLVRSQRGALAIRGGDLRTALVEYRAALPLAEHATPFDRGVILGNAGIAHLYAGQLRAARPLFERAVALAAAEGLAGQQAKALHNLGYLEFLAGDLPKALQLMAQASAVPELPGGIPLLDRARVLTEAGLLREADSLLAAAAAIFRRDRMPQDLGEVELARIRRTRRRRRPGHPPVGRRSARPVPYPRCGPLAAPRRADPPPGRPRSRTSRTSHRPVRPAPAGRIRRRRVAATGAQRCAHRRGGLACRRRWPRGRSRARRAAARRSHGSDHRAAARTLRARPVGRCHPASGGGTRRISSGLAELAGYQASFGSVDLASAAAVHGRRLAEYGIALAREASQPAAVFAAAERARAVTSRLAPLRPPDDPLVADRLAELRQTVEALRAVEHDRLASAPLLERRFELERAIVARGWSAAGSGSVARPAKLADVRTELNSTGCTMISFVQAAGNLSAVTVGARVRLHDLGPAAAAIEHVLRVRADLDVLAQSRLPGGIRAAARASLDRSLRELDRALIGPLRIDEPLVIVSTGVLGQLPWASLPSLRGRSLVVVPSATKWLASATAPAGRTGTRGRVVALAGPGLPRAGEEASAVCAAWPAAELVAGSEASTQAFAAAVGSASVLHVAAHGLHQPENPLFSFVRMADGPIFAHELGRTSRAPDHVVLSACEVGLATVRPGDEALGMASALLHLGTRSVVAGVARVNDEVAARVMTSYHRSLVTGTDSAAALAGALVEADTDVIAPFVNFGAAWRPAVG